MHLRSGKISLNWVWIWSVQWMLRQWFWKYWWLAMCWTFHEYYFCQSMSGQSVCWSDTFSDQAKNYNPHIRWHYIPPPPIYSEWPPPLSSPLFELSLHCLHMCIWERLVRIWQSVFYVSTWLFTTGYSRSVVLCSSALLMFCHAGCTDDQCLHSCWVLSLVPCFRKDHCTT